MSFTTKFKLLNNPVLYIWISLLEVPMEPLLVFWCFGVFVWVVLCVLCFCLSRFICVWVCCVCFCVVLWVLCFYDLCLLMFFVRFCLLSFFLVCCFLCCLVCCLCVFPGWAWPPSRRPPFENVQSLGVGRAASLVRGDLSHATRSWQNLKAVREPSIMMFVCLCY